MLLCISPSLLFLQLEIFHPANLRILKKEQSYNQTSIKLFLSIPGTTQLWNTALLKKRK